MTTPIFPCECGKMMFLSPGTMGPCCFEANRAARNALAAKEAEAAEPVKPTYACACGEYWSLTPGPAVLACCIRNGYSVAPGGSGILHVPPELGEIIGVDALTGEPIYGPPTLPVSSDIMTPDPDTKGTTMTDTTDTEILPSEPETLRVVREGETRIYTAHTAAQTTALLDQCGYSPSMSPFVQKARKSEATGVLGLYLEAVAHTASGVPFNHLKFFVIGSNIYVYNRSNGETRANWKIRKAPSLHAALNLVQEAINKPSVKLFGHLVLVELTADDLSAVESGAMPPARFRGQYRIERDFGRYDFAMDVTSKPMPARLLRLLTNGYIAAEPAPV